MLPAIMLVQTEIDLDERTPLRTLGLADEMHPCLLWSSIRFECIALDAGANNIFPGGRSPSIARDDVIQIQVLSIENSPAILAGIAVTLE